MSGAPRFPPGTYNNFLAVLIFSLRLANDHPPRITYLRFEQIFVDSIPLHVGFFARGLALAMAFPLLAITFPT